ncbi:hydroquinone glucosyltransferase-like [Cicer arietinum]
MQSFRETLRLSSTSTKPLVAIIADPFASQAIEIAKEFNLLSFIYFPFSAMTTSLQLYLPTLHQQVSCEHKDHTHLIQIPGCIPIRSQDLPPEIFRDRISYELALQHCKMIPLADGVVFNSFLEMEESTVKNLQYNNNLLVYVVGPIIQTGSNSKNQSNGSVCVKWLDNQKPNSVLYVSFGSGGTLSQQQLNELAFGLELSGQKFLWVVREPSKSSNVDYQSVENVDDDDDIFKYLPNGFLERTKDQGLVVPLWVPQTQILSHSSTGGFLTHCGWNSILESIFEGVPIITWPLFADQGVNDILLTEGLKVGLKVKFNEINGVAERDEIGKVIRDLMIGEERSEIQQRIYELKDAANGALAKDGSSIRALSHLGTQMKSKGINKV